MMDPPEEPPEDVAAGAAADVGVWAGTEEVVGSTGVAAAGFGAGGAI
jgi:hypothetical protein